MKTAPVPPSPPSVSVSAPMFHIMSRTRLASFLWNKKGTRLRTRPRILRNSSLNEDAPLSRHGAPDPAVHVHRTDGMAKGSVADHGAHESMTKPNLTCPKHLRQLLPMLHNVRLTAHQCIPSGVHARMRVRVFARVRLHLYNALCTTGPLHNTETNTYNIPPHGIKQRVALH